MTDPWAGTPYADKPSAREVVDAWAARTITPPDFGKAWCPDCRRMKVVEDASDESTYSGAHEIGFFVQRLECGHDKHFERGIIGASPGGESAAEAMEQAATQQRVRRAVDMEFE